MAIPFLKGIDVAGTVDLGNLTIDGAQGTDGQVLTSTGSGIAWEDASGGASLSGGAANKLAIWSGTDALTNDTNLHWNTTNDQLGIGNANPQAKLDITQTATAKGINIRSSSVQPEITFIDGATGDSFAIGHNRSGSRMDIEINGTDTHTFKQNGNVGFGTTNPTRPLVVSETRTGSTATDAYTTVVKSVQSANADPNPGTGGLKVQYTSSSNNVHAFGLVAGSSSSDFLTTGPMHFYTNSDLDTVSATGFAMQLDTSQRLTIGSTTATQKLNVDGNVKANRYYGHSSTTYYVDPDDGTASAILNGAVAIGDNATPAHKLVVRTPAGYGDGADGIFIKSSFAGSSPVVTDKDPFLSIGCADSSSAVSTIFMGQDATATSQETKIEYSHDNDALSIYKSQMGAYREHVRFGNVNSTATARTRFYGNVGIGTDPSSPLHVSGDIQTTTGSVKIADNWGQGFYSAEQLSIVGSYPSLALRNNNDDNKWLIHHDGNDLTFYAGADYDSNSWAKKVHVDSGNQGMGAQRFYDIDSTAYYVEPGSVSILNDLDLKNNGILKFYRAGGNALQRADARVENSTTARLHWYGSNDSGSNTAFQHAWYDGSNYINVTASNPGVITFAGSAASMYIGSDRVFDDGYHPNADKWTTARTLSLTGDVTGSVSWDGSANATLTTNVGDADTVDGYHASRFFRRIAKATATVGPGWMTVAENVSGRKAGEIVVTDADSGDHAYIRIEWMRSYSDSNFTVLNCGGHANRITGARVLYNTSDNTYGGKKLQVYVTTSSTYEVNIYEQGDIDDYEGHGVVTPVIQNTISGYALHGRQLENLDTFGFAAEEGILSGGDLKVLGTGDGIHVDSTGHASLRLDRASTSYDNNILFMTGGGIKWRLWQDGTDDQLMIRDNANSYNSVVFNAGGASGNTTFNNDVHLGTYSGTAQSRLFLNGTTANKQAKIQCTNGNLHIDSEDGHGLYLNYYEGTTDNVIIGNGNGGASGTILKNTGRINAGEHVIANNNVYSGAGYFVFGTSTSEGEYIARSGDALTFYSGGAIKFDITPSNGVHVRNGSSYFAQISNTGEGRFGGDVTAYYNFSDKRLKTNIKPTTDNLDKVLNLNPVEYNWKEGYRKDKKEIGLIAQEVEKIIPEVVRENKRLNDDTLYKQVDYEHLVSTLIGAVQEQQKQIDELKAIINGSS